MGYSMIFLKTLWLKIWPWLIALAGVAISALAVIARLTMKENRRLRVRVENAEAKVNHARVVSQKDITLIRKEQERKVEINKDRDDGRTDYDPNELFKGDND
jgi:hypothetical protein